MKNKISSATFCILLFLTCACNDWLDLQPSTAVVDSGKSVKSLNDASYRLNGIYSLMRSYYYYGARMTYYGDALGEDMMAQSNTKRTANYYTFRFTEDNAPATFWLACYTIINNVNLLLEGIDNLTGLSEADEKKRMDYKGQALSIRALAYFDLTRLYGYPYTKDNGASWSVPIVDKPVSPDYKPKRNTVAECYNFILKDLNDAVEMLGEAKINGKMNKWAAMSLLARVYLYKGENDNALKFAKDAIAGAEKNKYRLWTNAEYKTEWAVEYGVEVLFEIPMTLAENEGNEAMPYLVIGSGYDDILLSDDWMVKLMGNQTGDVRYQCVINNTSSGSKSGRRYLWKYPVNSGETAAYLGNIKVLRLSETYLIAAEAAAKKGSANDDAVRYLDPIVKRGNPNNTVSGTTVNLDRVLEERRKELVGEGHRFFDAIRNGKHITRSGDLAFKHLDNILPEAWDFDWNYFKVVLPVPRSEMDANENIRDQQNPGY